MKKIKIPLKLYLEIEGYCSFNKIDDIEKEITKYIQQGFNIKRFGVTPFTQQVKKTNDMKKEENAVKQELPPIEKKKTSGINIIKK